MCSPKSTRVLHFVTFIICHAYGTYEQHYFSSQALMLSLRAIGSTTTVTA